MERTAFLEAQVDAVITIHFENDSAHQRLSDTGQEEILHRFRDRDREPRLVAIEAGQARQQERYVESMRRMDYIQAWAAQKPKDGETHRS